MAPTTSERVGTTHPVRPRLQQLAASLAGAIALIYGLLYLEVLTIAGASDDERGILGMAAMVFVLIGVLVWWRRSRWLWAVVAGVQVLMGGMYLAIAPERDPSFEVWGITIRVLSLGLLIAVVTLWLDARRDRADPRS
jgi:hypothetical protein